MIAKRVLALWGSFAVAVGSAAAILPASAVIAAFAYPSSWNKRGVYRLQKVWPDLPDAVIAAAVVLPAFLFLVIITRVVALRWRQNLPASCLAAIMPSAWLLGIFVAIPQDPGLEHLRYDVIERILTPMGRTPLILGFVTWAATMILHLLCGVEESRDRPIRDSVDED